MDSKESIKRLLKDLRVGKISANKAFDSLKHLPFKNLNFARLDSHRLLRKDFGEVVYCEGKSHQQVLSILPVRPA